VITKNDVPEKQPSSAVGDPPLECKKDKERANDGR